MITEWQIYWITRLDYIQGFFLLIGILTTIFLSVALIIRIVQKLEENEYSSKNEKITKDIFIKKILRGLILSLLFVIIGIMIPNAKEMCAIKIIPVIVNNEKAQQIPDKMLNLANEWLDELKPKKEK